MRALTIAWKDIRHVYRSFAGLAMMLVAPLLLAGALGAAFGSGNNFSIVAGEDRGGRPGRGRRGGHARRRRHAHGRAHQPGAGRPADRHPGRPPPRRRRAAVDSGDAEVAVIIPPGLTQALSAADAVAAAGGDLQGPDRHHRPGHRHRGGAGRGRSRSTGPGPRPRPPRNWPPSQGITDPRPAHGPRHARPPRPTAPRPRRRATIALESRAPGHARAARAVQAAQHGRPGARRA